MPSGPTTVTSSPPWRSCSPMTGGGAKPEPAEGFGLCVCGGTRARRAEPGLDARHTLAAPRPPVAGLPARSSARRRTAGRADDLASCRSSHGSRSAIATDSSTTSIVLGGSIGPDGDGGEVIGPVSHEFEIGRPLIRRLGVHRPFFGAVAGVPMHFLLASGITKRPPSEPTVSPSSAHDLGAKGCSAAPVPVRVVARHLRREMPDEPQRRTHRHRYRNPNRA
jgi:hypothetical protein